MKPYLFIGGPLDGTIISTDGRPKFVVSSEEGDGLAFGHLVNPDGDGGQRRPKEHWYVLIHIEESVSVYVDKQSIDFARDRMMYDREYILKRLVANYRPYRKLEEDLFNKR